jgi:hypothetical protein
LFTHKTTAEGEALLDRILKNSPPLEPLRVEPEPEEVSSAEAEPIESIEKPSPKPEDLEEGFQPLDLPYFEDKLFEDFRNILNYACQKRPLVPVSPCKPLDNEFLRESIKELTTIMSSEWVAEGEHSSEEIQICILPMTIRCKVLRTMVDVLYSPTVGANLMSKSFASAYFGKKPLAPTIRFFRNNPRSILKGHVILHNITIHHDNFEMSLDFHVFDIQDFDIMIGHPVEKLFVDPSKIGDLDVKLGRNTFTTPITRVKNSVAESLPYPDLQRIADQLDNIYL